MKRNLLLLAFLLSAHLSFSQLKIHPKVGGVISSQNLEFGHSENRDYSHLQSKKGLMAGLGLEKTLSNKVALSADIQYVELGYKDNFKSPYTIEKDVYNLKYLITPVGLKYRILGGRKLNVFLNGGMYGGVYLEGKHVYSEDRIQLYYHYNPNFGNGESYMKVNDKYKYDRFDWGLQLGGGADFKLAGNEFVVEAKYALGISDVHETEIRYWAGTDTYYEYQSNGKNRFFSLSLGYVLPFWRKEN